MSKNIKINFNRQNSNSNNEQEKKDNNSSIKKKIVIHRKNNEDNVKEENDIKNIKSIDNSINQNKVIDEDAISMSLDTFLNSSSTSSPTSSTPSTTSSVSSTSSILSTSSDSLTSSMSSMSSPISPSASISSNHSSSFNQNNLEEPENKHIENEELNNKIKEINDIFGDIETNYDNEYIEDVDDIKDIEDITGIKSIEDINNDTINNNNNTVNSNIINTDIANTDTNINIDESINKILEKENNKKKSEKELEENINKVYKEKEKNSKNKISLKKPSTMGKIIICASVVLIFGVVGLFASTMFFSADNNNSDAIQTYESSDSNSDSVDSNSKNVESNSESTGSNSGSANYSNTDSNSESNIGTDSITTGTTSVTTDAAAAVATDTTAVTAAASTTSRDPSSNLSKENPFQPHSGNNNNNSDNSNNYIPLNFGGEGEIPLEEVFSEEAYRTMCYNFEDDSYTAMRAMRNLFTILKPVQNENKEKSGNSGAKNGEATQESSGKTPNKPGNSGQTPKETQTTTRSNNEYDPSKGLIKEKWVQDNKTYDHYNDYLWVGDSRTYGMSGCIKITSVCKSAMGLNWMKSVTKDIYKYKNRNVIINFGINDLWNVKEYIKFYNSMPDEFFKNNKIFIMAVNPVDEVKQVNYGYSSRNKAIKEFNDQIKAGIRKDIVFIDSYDYLMKTGFNTCDGIHYDYNTYIKIHDFMVKTISNGKNLSKSK